MVFTKGWCYHTAFHIAYIGQLIDAQNSQFFQRRKDSWVRIQNDKQDGLRQSPLGGRQKNWLCSSDNIFFVTFKYYQILADKLYLFNRPGVAEAVLQTALQVID